jgi:hypothetical protein
VLRNHGLRDLLQFGCGEQPLRVFGHHSHLHRPVLGAKAFLDHEDRPVYVKGNVPLGLEVDLRVDQSERRCRRVEATRRRCEGSRWAKSRSRRFRCTSTPRSTRPAASAVLRQGKPRSIASCVAVTSWLCVCTGGFSWSAPSARRRPFGLRDVGRTFPRQHPGRVHPRPRRAFHAGLRRGGRLAGRNGGQDGWRQGLTPRRTSGRVGRHSAGGNHVERQPC